MKRLSLVLSIGLAALLAPVSIVQAAVPTLGPVEATNLQGVSAVLKGTVDPEGLATTYYFEYSTQPGFAAALKTPADDVGAGAEAQLARASISDLSPGTTYHYRLVAANASGSAQAESSFVTSAGFGFKPGAEGFAVDAFADGGDPASLAGSHPHQLSFELNLREGGEFENQPGVPFADGDLRDLAIELPPGMLLNPSAVATCSTANFNVPRISPFALSRSGESCPDASQVGTVEVKSSREGGLVRRFGVFNLDPSGGVAAQLGFAPFGTQIVFSVRPEADSSGRYSLALEAKGISQALDLRGLDLVLWGAPWAAAHNGERGNCLNEAEPTFPWAKCKVVTPEETAAYLTLPVECAPSLRFAARASSWQQPAAVASEAVNRDSLDQPVPLQGCSTVAFDPQPSALLTNRRASAPSGFDFSLVNDNAGFTDPELRAPSPISGLALRLPAGATVNPSVGAGLGACAPAQYAAETAFNGQGQACPNAAKIGEVQARSPLFAGELLQGAIYLAQPDEPATAGPGAENPFDTMIALYLVIKSSQRGLLIKVPGKVVADHATGRLTATFEDLPQLPYSDVQANLYHGQRPFLVTPPACGPATTEIQMTPWAGSGQRNAATSTQINAAFDDGPCPAGGTRPFVPGVVSGGVNAQVGAYTPYFVHLSRRDSEQEITAYSLVLPKGITGKLAGIPFCPDSAIAAARASRGFAEAANPSCPAASQVGRVETGYGVGNALAYAPGRIYLAGPYNGQPLSLVTVNAATIGPFDLGTYVIRSAFALDPKTAQLRIDAGSSDPIPHIVDGIPLHLRDIRVHMDRFQFTHNPSSCEASQLISTISGSGERFGDPSDDQSVTVARHFQLLNCLTLGFRPKLGLRLRGGSRRGSYPSLRATFAARGAQDSNLKRIEVTLPRSLFLAQEHIRGICSREQFAAERCPADSVYGEAVVHTLLFDTPLRGPVYLRSSTSRLPDLVASLRAGSVRIVVEGKIGPAKQGIRALFDDLPDAPIDRFTMTLHGGRRGLLVNSANICKAPPLASVRALGQNNLGAVFTSQLRGQCGKANKRRTG